MRNGLKKLFLKLAFLVIISIFSYIFLDIENTTQILFVLLVTLFVFFFIENYDHFKSKNK
ncbi:hypothetical protein BU678_10935 [Staphylococcus chromogenes]|nr:hypothetical protein BU637_01355 [Staphylococcus chromogenes]PTG65587.1 hypothetical protein BU674_00250 [Staphylococcus chromogenes]RIM05810.1 hypothetical protein BU683_03605 [Staphylococcus chromogenes]RIM09394.1 hypothetical protein BU678_10935 [Staphylococcus chromogenes]RIM15014.1 hypothetical protein BU672_09880 [Staphylococcus chromogenes]